MERLKGTEDTRAFYDAVGWKVDDAGRTADADMFGVREDGPIRQRMYRRRWSRIMEFLGPAPGSTAAEVGCGGSPERHIMAAFPEYTGIDFSEQGLSVARATTSGEWPGARFVPADAVALPFADASFDCVYSGHMLYHIAEPAAQERALSELVRVLRPGGALVLVSANPRPLLFPLRLLIRLAAETPGLRRIARRIKGPSPVPYNPQRIRWIRSRLARAGTVTVISGGMASTAFNRKVSEFRNPGRMLWLFLDRTEERFPQSAAHLGNYAVFLFRRADGAVEH